MPPRSTIGSHDDHDNFNGQPYASMAPHKHNRHHQVFIKAEGANCFKIQCLLQLQLHFYHNKGSTRIPYQDSSKIFT